MLYSLAPSSNKFKLKVTNTIDLKKINKQDFSKNLGDLSITEDNLKFLPQEYHTFSIKKYMFNKHMGAYSGDYKGLRGGSWRDYKGLWGL